MRISRFSCIVLELNDRFDKLLHASAKHWQPPQRGIKSLNSRERAGGCRAAGGGGGHCRAGVGTPRLGELEAGGGCKARGGTAELGAINYVHQLFTASSITPYFSLEL